MGAKRAVALLVAALAVYFGLIGYRGVFLIEQSRVDLKVLGVAVLVLPLIGMWVVVAEIRFGLATQRLGEHLDDGPDAGAGAAEDEPLPRRPSGRVDRAAADVIFERRRAEIEAAPADWRGWYRLAIAYDDAGDRKRARAAMRTAIEHAEPS